MGYNETRPHTSLKDQTPSAFARGALREVTTRHNDRQAKLASDCQALEELISADLIFTNHVGQVFGKQDDLKMHCNGVLKLHRLESSEVLT